MMTPGRIYLGLPAYNEEIALPRLLARIESLAQSSQLAITVVVYNDGSTDRTAAIASQWLQRVPLVLLDGKVNKGLGAGLRALTDYAVATGAADNVLVIMDCDDTHDPAQIPQMLVALANGADLVIASRFQSGATVRGVPLLRRLTALGAVILFKLIHPVCEVWDYTCGYRAYRIGLLQTAAARFPGRLVEEAGFACMVEVLLKLNASGARCAEIPLHLRYDLKPTASKMAVSSNMRRLLALLVRWRWRGFGAV
ncbi:MAG TPA: glycosyltransferase family 2 protein [Pseudolabrys sp.]|nr:glycosyltransferase family 2 protein [Pseudolabrys sp.]